MSRSADSIALELAPHDTSVAYNIFERMRTEVSLGWPLCGCNGCILLEAHAGDCVFPDLPIHGKSKRSRRSS